MILISQDKTKFCILGETTMVGRKQRCKENGNRPYTYDTKYCIDVGLLVASQSTKMGEYSTEKQEQKVFNEIVTAYINNDDSYELPEDKEELL